MLAVYVPLFVRFPAIPTTAAADSVMVPPMVTSEPKTSVAAADSVKDPPLLIVTAPVNVLVPVADVIVRLLPLKPPPIVVVPETVKAKAPTDSAEAALTSLMVRVAQAAAAPTVTVNPPPMFTISPATGKVPAFVALAKPTVDQVVFTAQAAEALE